MKRFLVVLLILCNLGFPSMGQAGSAIVTYIYTDGQGSPVAEADGAGNVIATFDYTPYGSTLLGAQRNGPGYTGHVADPDTSLTYMQARYYDPSMGRFLSVDPVMPKAGTVAGFNAYAYAENNPASHTDPDGRSVTCDDFSCTIDSRSVFDVAVDYLTFAVIYTERAIQNARQAHGVYNEAQGEAPPLPKGLVGVKDSKSRQKGGRVLDGPLAPSHGGTGDSAKDFETLTGGKSAPAAPEQDYPPGTMVGENGISHRPATEKAGPRIDIPANGDKPMETLHYPKPPPPPPTPQTTQNM